METNKESLLSEASPENDKSYAVVYFLSYITLGLSTATLGPMLVQIGAAIDRPLTGVSTLIGMKSIGYFFGSVGGGRLFDKIKGHNLQVISVSLMALCMFFIPLTTNLVVMSTVMILLGAMEGLLDVGGNTLLVWKFKSKVAPYMNGLHFFFGLGAFLAPIIIANIIPYENSFRWSYWVLGALFIPSAIGFALLKSPDPIRSEKTAVIQRKPSNYLVTLIILLFFTYVGTELSFGSWISTYTSLSNYASEIWAVYLTSIYWGAFTFGRLLGIVLSRWIKPFVFLIIDIIGSIISLVLMIFLAKDLVSLIVCTALIGIFLSSVFPMLIVFAEKKVKITGAMTGLFFLGASTGGLVFPFILTGLFNQYGYQIIPIVLLISSFLSLMILYSIHTQGNIRKGELFQNE